MKLQVEIEQATVLSASKPQSVLQANKQVLLCCLTFLFFLIISYFVIHQHNPPNALAIDAPATEFSSGRAMKHLQMIAQSPHPVGSPAHDDVRDYIANALLQLNLSPEVQTVEKKLSKNEPVVRIQNIMTRLEGLEPDGKAVMLVAHYDSAPHSYGASDDGAGVVTLLESLRALTSGPPLKKDVIALFTDGEELGVVGAAAFIEQHRWASGVGVVLNFEARGSRGPAFMFETSDGNGMLIQEFARAVTHPFTSSAASLVYENLSHHTDLTIFKQAGYTGLNFAYVGATKDYHSENDSLERIDERSVQHQGLYALALARHFGNLSGEVIRAEDRVYFDVLGKSVISYSKSFARVMTVCSIVLFAAIAVYGIIKGRLSLKGMAIGVLTFTLSYIAVVITATAAQEAVSFKSDVEGIISNDRLYAVFLFALTVAIASSCYLYFNRRWGWEDLSSGTLIVHLVFLGLVTVYITGAAYLLAWPFLFSLPVLAFTVSGGSRRADRLTPFVGLCLSALPAIIILLWAAISVLQVISLLHPIVFITIVSLLIGFLVPFLKYLANPYRWLLPTLSLLVCAIAVTVAVATTTAR